MTSSQNRKQRKAQAKALRRADRETPILEFEYHPFALAFQGPIINTDLTITDSHRTELIQAGQSVPPPVRCRFLIDTGADGSVVWHDFALRAGLKLINASAPIGGIGVDSTGRTYMGRILFIIPSRSAIGVHINVAVDTQIAGATPHSPEIAARIDGLIGRDVLQHFDLTYNGQTGKVTMRYLKQRQP